MVSYSATIKTGTSADRAYTAIAEEMSHWWTPMSGKFLAIGDQAQTDFGGQSYWRFEAQTLDAPNLIALRCCEAHHIHDGLPEEIREEWLDTMLIFDIAQEDGRTCVTLTHQGLTPDLKCYEVCEQGWNHYFLGSLKEYLEKK